MAKKTFHRQERLKQRRLINLLFSEGKSFVIYPLRIVYLPIDRTGSTPVKMSVSVSKRYFPLAVRRNLLRRRIREAYRLRKEYLYEELNERKSAYVFMLIYIGKDILPYSDIDKAMYKLLRRFIRREMSNRPTK